MKIGELIQKFILANPKRAIWFMASMGPKFWEKKGEESVLRTFQQALRSPAYSDFLKKNNVDPTAIKTIEDFKNKVPLTTKENFLSFYSLSELYAESEKEIFGMCFTSGTSGKPSATLYSKKDIFLGIAGAINYLHYCWNICSPSISTLCINGFALGPWLASFSSNCVGTEMALKYNITLTTPGSDPLMILEALQKIGKKYDQVIISAYPSVLKNLLEEGEKQKINWQDFNLKIVSAGEPLIYSLWNYILEKIDPKTKNPTRILDFYGVTETSPFGLGTPLCLAIKKIANENKEFCKDLFGQEEILSLFQYNPAFIFLEKIDGKLVVTRPGPVPLVRYLIGDFGKVISFSQMKEKLKNFGYNIDSLTKIIDWKKKPFKWPFYSYLGRTDDMVIAYSGAKIYARNLLPLCEKLEKINSFKMTSKFDSEYNLKLIVYLELKKGLRPLTEMEEKYQKEIHQQLLKSNIDYRDAYHLSPEKVLPKVKIFGFGQGPFKEDKTKPKPKLKI